MPLCPAMTAPRQGGEPTRPMYTFQRRPIRLFVRVAFYLSVMTIVFVLRGQKAQRGIGFRLPNESDTVTTITLMGRELAPGMVPRLAQNYF